MLKTDFEFTKKAEKAYHLGEGRVLKTYGIAADATLGAYHLGEGRVLKTLPPPRSRPSRAYHLGEGRVLKTQRYQQEHH